MGLNIASEAFQDFFSNKLADLKNIRVAIDDVLVYGKTEEEHDQALHALLSRIRILGLTCNPIKCVFKASEIDFFEMKISKNGIQPKEDKLKDFIDAGRPKDSKELRSFMGMSTYFSNRIIGLAEISEPLRQLLKKGAKFEWNTEHDDAFNKIKDGLFGAQFTMMTDNKAVSMIIDSEHDLKRKTSIRLQGWRSRMSQYNFKVKHVSGESNIADYLSRCLKAKTYVPSCELLE